MNLSEKALNNKALVYFIVFILVIGGIYSFFQMSKLEDPAITVKQAMIVTIYPGASAHKVELEVTDVLEKAIRTMGDLDHIESRSMDDVSMIMVELKSTIPPSQLQQKWDILRRKVSAAESRLPQGAQAPLVHDDFGNVYGMFYIMTSDGIESTLMTDYAQMVRRSLQEIPGVSSVVLYGEEKPCVNVEIIQDKIANLGIHPAEILLTLNKQNQSVYSGYFESDNQRIKVEVDDAFTSLESIRNLLIAGHEGDMIRLESIANVTRGYVTPRRQGVKYDDINGIAISIAMDDGENVLKLGEQVEARLAQLQGSTIPVGIDFKKVSFQPQLVQNAINVFMINLIESVVIVILVIMLAMGFRSGYIIGMNLIIVVLGSLLVLFMMKGTLQRVSLASFIVAMGMLVDNAIVIVDGIMVDMRRGMDRRKSLVNIAAQTATPLLGATAIGVLTFLPIFLSPDTTGEYVKDLFIVLAVSLFLSWILALIYCPIQASRSLKADPNAITDEELYQRPIYRYFRNTLRFALNNRGAVILSTLLLLCLSIFAFRFVKQGFFPDLSYTQLYIEYKLPYGTSSNKVVEDLDSISNYLMRRADIEHVTTSLGGTPSRYNLVRTVPEPDMNYGELIVDFTSAEHLKNSFEELQRYLEDHYPDAFVRLKRYNLMYKDFPVQFQISGPDPEVLRNLCAQVEQFMTDEPSAMLVKNNWSDEVPILTVCYNQILAREASLSRSDVGMSLLSATDGLPVGSYFEGVHSLPIYLKSVDSNGELLEELNNVPVWSMVPSINGVSKNDVTQLLTGKLKREDIIEKVIGSTPLNQVAPQIKLNWRTPIVRRYDGQRAISAQCNARPGYTANDVRKALLDKVASLDIPVGYSTMWQGEYQASEKSKKYLFGKIPIAIILTIGILVALFKDFKKPTMILLCLPLAMIGIVFGMLIAGKEFGFVAIVGMLGLIGMMIKNGVVLVDEVDSQIASGKDAYMSIIDATSSRLRPVVLAALTTILGMLPLINDDMFGSLAVTIMSGLLMGTGITLLFLPVLYSLFFKIKETKKHNEKNTNPIPVSYQDC
ncbi:MAG: efflux RND transporter permease subunit [Marinifilaceae bacterium]